MRRPLKLEPADGDAFVTITQDLLQRPDLISNKAYGTPDLWWALYEFNEIRDPLFELQLGQVLRIPELERVLSAVKELEEG